MAHQPMRCRASRVDSPENHVSADACDESARDACSSDLNAYHAEAASKAVLRLRRWLKFFTAVVLPTMAALQVLHGFHYLHLVFNMLPLAIFFIVDRFGKDSSCTIHSIWISCCIQMLFFGVCGLLAICLSLHAPTELMQHRIFLTLWIPVTAAGQSWCHMPLRIYISGFCTIFMLFWVVFHCIVGFLTLPCVMYGIMFSAAGSFLYWLKDEDNRHRFQINRKLKEEHELLVATQVTLHGMLSTLFDASCICRDDGVLMECTPQLQQLFGGGDAIIGSDFCSFAATERECQRIREFLKTATSSVHQAAKIQSAFRIGQISCEAVLYAILLPDKGISASNANSPQKSPHRVHDKVFFVGLQAPSVSQFMVPAEHNLEPSPNEATTPATAVDGRTLPAGRIDRNVTFSSKVSVMDFAPGCPSSEPEGTTSELEYSASLTPTASETAIAEFLSDDTPIHPRSIHQDLQSQAFELSQKKSCGVQTERTMVDQSVQTTALQSLPPKLPDTSVRNARTAKQKVSSPQGSARSGSVSSESRIASSNESGESSLLASSKGSLQTIEDNNIEILLGGNDWQSSWKYVGGQWQRVGAPAMSNGEVSLKDFMSLPTSSAGNRVSFGSLNHVVDNAECKRCMFMDRHRRCRNGALCSFCHADHRQTVIRSRRIMKP